MIPPSTNQPDRDAQLIYERGVYAGIILLLWMVLFLEFKHPLVWFIISGCFSAIIMAIYAPLFRLFRRFLLKRAVVASRRRQIIIATTIIYEVSLLWFLRGSLPLWALFLVAMVMTIYYTRTYLMQETQNTSPKDDVSVTE